jgi:predicted nucleic acid-binding protein
MTRTAAPPFIDTSALIKWFIREPGSDAFSAFVEGHERVLIARIGFVELRSALARRRRAGDITSRLESECYDLFRREVIGGFIAVLPSTDDQILAAGDLIAEAAAIPLRTLDAIHLAAAIEAKATLLATADSVMSLAAHRLGIEVAFFGR